MKWCLTNTGVQTDRNGNIVPIKNQSPKQRIDGTAALEVEKAAAFVIKYIEFLYIGRAALWIFQKYLQLQNKS